MTLYDRAGVEILSAETRHWHEVCTSIILYVCMQWLVVPKSFGRGRGRGRAGSVTTRKKQPHLKNQSDCVLRKLQLCIDHSDETLHPEQV